MAEVEMPVVKLGNQGLEVNQKQAILWVFFFVNFHQEWIMVILFN